MQTPVQTDKDRAQPGYFQLFRDMYKQNIRKYSMVIALVFIMLLFQILTDGILLRPLNITNLILQNSYILILAIGMMLVIITGHIDLSVGSVAAFVGAVSAMMIIENDMPLFAAVVLSLLLGAAIGAWQGFWIAYVKIPAFIVTLAGMLLFRGLTMIVLEGKSIAPFPVSFKNGVRFYPGLAERRHVPFDDDCRRSGSVDSLSRISASAEKHAEEIPI